MAATNPELRNELSEMNRAIAGWKEGVDPFYGAPVVLVVLADKTEYAPECDGSLIMQNLMLAAHSLGIGSCWVHRAKEEFESQRGKEILSELGIVGDYVGLATAFWAIRQLSQEKPGIVNLEECILPSSMTKRPAASAIAICVPAASKEVDPERLSAPSRCPRLLKCKL